MKKYFEVWCAGTFCEKGKVNKRAAKKKKKKNFER